MFNVKTQLKYFNVVLVDIVKSSIRILQDATYISKLLTLLNPDLKNNNIQTLYTKHLNIIFLKCIYKNINKNTPTQYTTVVIYNIYTIYIC